MTLPCNPAEPRIRRHDLVFLHPAAWHASLEARGDLAGEKLVAGWADEGWPLVGRRPLPGEGPGVPLGLPLPPFAGKRRISVLMQPRDIAVTTAPPSLRHALCVAPRAWWPVLERVEDLAARHGAEARVFGSLAWQVLTGLPYLTGRSDLDLLLRVRRGTDIVALTAGLAAIEAGTSLRLDGELIREDGAAVNWRELHAGARQVLLKSQDGVALCEAGWFLAEAGVA